MATATEPDDGPTELYPFNEQEPFLRADHRYYAYVSGVGAGKTYAGMLRMVLNVEEWNPGEMHAIVAPTTTMIKDVIIPQFRQAGILDYWEYKSAHSDEPGLHAPNGSRVLLLSADNRRTIERLAGLNLASFWLDEASRVPERALEILTQRLRVGPYQNGYLTTTPMGQDHVYDFCMANEKYDEDLEYKHGEADVYEPERGDRLSILRVPTWVNPHTGDDYKDDMETKEGQTYEREILGRFVDYEGLVYSWFDPRDVSEGGHVKPFDPLEYDRTIDAINANIRTILYGVDWGRTHPFAIVVVGETVNGEYVVLDEVYQTGLDYNEMVALAKSTKEEYGPGRWYCDTEEPAAIDMFQKAGLDATKAEKSIMPGIQTVSAQRDGLVILSHCTNVINEFKSYRYPDGGGEKPVDANNHAMDALRYAIMTHEKHGEPSVGVAFG